MVASQEVRWFLNNSLDAYPGVKLWVENFCPVKKEETVVPPQWQGRLGNKPDIYLIIPEQTDMGIKWREGQLQIKGLQSSLGTQLFDGGYTGRVERWIKWSYEGAVIANTFGPWVNSVELDGVRHVKIFKSRCLRKVRMDPQSGESREVDATKSIDRGGNLEVAQLTVGSASYCSIAFEAFPDDSEMHAAFSRFVNTFLGGLQGVELQTSNSMSYPAWLVARSWE
jgi:hypothetical protein